MASDEKPRQTGDAGERGTGKGRGSKRASTGGKPATRRPGKTGKGGKRRTGERRTKAAGTAKPSPTGDAGTPERPSFPIVGLGTSAGGVEALSAFFQALPDRRGIAFVVVPHLDPDRQSYMVEILARKTTLEVVEVEDEMPVEPDRVYVIRPGRWMTISGGVLHLAETSRRHGGRPVDRFFESLAEECQEKAICIVLSGTGSNGTAGLRAVKERGGMAMAQDPDSAAFDGMPKNAIGSGLVDRVLAPEEMPEALLAYLDHPYARREWAGRREKAAASDLQEVLALLQTRTRHQFHHYRKPTFTRRLHRRMGVRQVEKMEDYVALLRADPDEVESLVRDLLINVTGFFRDPEAWEALAEEALRPLLAERRTDEPFRAWVPACATGEEAYSLALLLAEEIERRERRAPEVKIFATDVAYEALDRARAGVFPASVAEDLSPERLERFFEREGDACRVRKEVRERVVFAPHDLLADPPFSRLDLVSCRNLLIYLEPPAQRRVITLLHFALREGGILFLGSAETLGRNEDRLFEPVSKKWRIYRRVGPTRHDLVEFPLPGPAEDAPPGVAPRPERSRWAPLVRQALVDRFAPASVLVDHRQQILYFHGATDEFLAQPAGEPTRDLMALVRSDLRSRLRSALHTAATEDRPVTVGARLGPAGRSAPVRVTALPLKEVSEKLTVVSFERVREPRPQEVGAPEARSGGAEVTAETELKRTRDELRSTIEELETSNEELKASNEEVISINEELQSSNEELETSKEELQSLNEELNTVNSQLQQKVQELEDATSDLSNLLNSSDIGTLFLDREMRVRRFTPAIRHLVDLRNADLGRPIGHFARKFTDEALVADAEQVLESLVPREAVVRSDDGRWYLRRVVPYRTEDDRIDGVVVTFTDVTERTRAEEELRRLNEELEGEVALRTGFVRLLQDVAVISNQAESVEAALLDTLSRVCLHNGWQAGQVYWALNGRAVAADILHVAPGNDPHRFRAALARESFDAGEGMVGRVVASGEAQWSTDLAADPGFLRPRAAELGLASAIALPVLVGERVAAVIEFFSDRPIVAEARLLEVMGNVGTQLGRVVERMEAERRVIDLAEEEQRRLGEELHDTLGQQVSGLAMLAQSHARSLDDEGSPHAAKARELAESLRAAQEQVRSLSRGLVPVAIEAGGLAEALEEIAEHCEPLYGVPCTFASEGPVRVDDRRLATSLYRIGREGVRNAARHARPASIEIRLAESEGTIRLEVRDDGTGMEAPPAENEGLGLRILHHQAESVGGRLEIESAPGRGTTIRCTVPAGGGRKG